MATKLKSINRPVNFFVGLISWLAFLSLIFTLASVIAGLILVLLQSELAGDMGKVLYLLPNFGEIPHDVCIRFGSILLLCAAALTLTILFRAERKRFESAFARFLARVWFELKLLFIPAVLYLTSLMHNFWLMLLVVVLLVYLICLDIGTNKFIFRRNIASSVLSALNQAKKNSEYEYVAIKKLISTIAVTISVIIFDALAVSVISYLVETHLLDSRKSSWITAMIIFASLSGIIGAVSWYYLSLKKDLDDLSGLTVQIEKMYSGNLNAVNHLPPTSSFYDLGMQLNMIRTGIEKAVSEGIKADKTKVELITNVSHDIKTPLTSIITYIELLKKEEGLPEHVQDYISTLSNKANRLSHIVQDIFEVSKAATGNLALNLDTLDLTRLLQQTLAEMEESMNRVQLTWRLDITEEPLMIQADGQKMYRVFQNLIRNCAQYALEGSRAYITLRKVHGLAEFTIRNVARTELDSSEAEYLTGRFVRGDQNRTTEGSGLGLSIAKSFTEACGGKFTLKIDGDIFLVQVIFELEKQAPPALSQTAPAAQPAEAEVSSEETEPPALQDEADASD